MVYSYARQLLAVSSIALSVGIANAASAQDAANAAVPPAATAEPQAADGGIPDIVVTAQKRSQKLDDIGLTISVVDSQQLADRGVTTATDLAKAVPGFTVATSGSGNPIFTLRGVSFASVNFGTSPTVSVYVDEAPVPFSIMTQGALLDLDHVEVLKGPQGTLFGQNSTAGALNYIAAKPTADFHGGIQASYSRFNTLQVDGYLSGPLTDTLKARVAFSATRSGPWQQSASRADELGSQRRTAARLLLDWHPTDRLRVSLNVNGWLDRSDTQAPQLVQKRPVNPPFASPVLLAAPLTTRNARDADWDAGSSFRKNDSFYQAALRAEYSLGANTTLTSLTDFTKARLNSPYDFDGTPTNVLRVDSSGYVRAFTQEVRLSGALADNRIHYIIGGNYQSDSSYERLFYDFTHSSQVKNVAGIGSFDLIDTRGRQSNKNYALFANLDWNVTDRLSISGGLRRTWVTHHARGCTLDAGDGEAAFVLGALGNLIRGAVGLPPAPPIPAGACVTLGPTFESYELNDSFKERNLSWRGNVNYKLNPDTLIYATVSRGFKAGNYPVQAASTVLSLAPVVQEELTSYEGGIKIKLFDRKLSINAAGFYYDYRNKQLQTIFIAPAFGTQFGIRNIPKSTVRGFDIDATIVPIDGLTLRSALTYAKSRVGDFNAFDAFGNSVQLKGAPFNLAPKWISVSDVEYRRPVSSTLEAIVGASVTYNSRTTSDISGTPSFAVDPFTTLDLRLGISSKAGWKVQVFGRNVTNTYYWTYGVIGGDTVLRYAAMPATYGISVGYKF